MAASGTVPRKSARAPPLALVQYSISCSCCPSCDPSTSRAGWTERCGRSSALLPGFTRGTRTARLAKLRRARGVSDRMLISGRSRARHTTLNFKNRGHRERTDVPLPPPRTWWELRGQARVAFRRMYLGLDDDWWPSLADLNPRGCGLSHYFLHRRDWSFTGWYWDHGRAADGPRTVSFPSGLPHTALPAAAALMSPTVDLTSSGASITERADQDPISTRHAPSVRLRLPSVPRLKFMT